MQVPIWIIVEPIVADLPAFGTPGPAGPRVRHVDELDVVDRDRAAHGAERPRGGWGGAETVSAWTPEARLTLRGAQLCHFQKSQSSHRIE